MKRISLQVVFAAVMIVLMTSCSKKFYQVYDVKSDNVKVDINNMVYSNEDCDVYYNLWAENGKLDFIIKNKTDKDMFISMPQSFYIENGVAYDYYKDREFIVSSTIANIYASSYSYSNIYTTGTVNGNGYVNVSGSNVNAKGSGNSSNFSNGSKSTSANHVTSGITIKEAKIIILPPHTMKKVSGYRLYQNAFISCTKEANKINLPKDKSEKVTFTKENSPLVFRNRIAYSFDSECKTLKYIDNEFWMSGYMNYSKKSIIEKEYPVDCLSGKKSTVGYERFIFSNPDKFYNVYQVEKKKN